MDGQPGGLVGGLFAVFDGIGLLFFTILIGQRAQNPSLRTHRVIFGGLLFGLAIGGILGAVLLQNLPLPGLIGMGIGIALGIALAGILLGYISSLEKEEYQARIREEAEEERRALEPKINALKAREKLRIQQAQQQGKPFKKVVEERRAGLVDEGIDPDDPQEVLSSGYDSRGGCFIATATFENPNAPEVVSLRQWRDKSLASSSVGRLAIRLYYHLSPSVAGVIAGRPFLKRRVKGLLRKLIKILPA